MRTSPSMFLFQPTGKGGGTRGIPLSLKGMTQKFRCDFCSFPIGSTESYVHPQVQSRLSNVDFIWDSSVTIGRRRKWKLRNNEQSLPQNGIIGGLI